MLLFDPIRPKPPIPEEADRLQLRHGAAKALALVRADLARAGRARRRRLWRLHDELVHRILRSYQAQDDCLA